MDTITQTSVYSPGYTAYWTLNYATMKRYRVSLSCQNYIQIAPSSWVSNDIVETSGQSIYRNWNHFRHFKKAQVYYNVLTSSFIRMVMFKEEGFEDQNSDFRNLFRCLHNLFKFIKHKPLPLVLDLCTYLQN